jgi:uncharacterized protein (DUF1697 family)
MAPVPSRYVALLRGINVGGNNKVAMADLRDIVSGLGHTEVATYIQSGNVVFTATECDTSVLAEQLERAIAATLPVGPQVVVVHRDELAAIVSANPYPDQSNHKLLHAFFLREPAGPGVEVDIAEAQAKARDKGSRDEAQLIGRVVYLHTPDGFGRSELAARLGRVKTLTSLGVTARNWATVQKLLAMCG